MTVSFMICNSFFSISYGEYMYFFQMNILKFSKFQYAMLNVFGYLTLFMGTMYYNKYLKEFEFRTLLKYACYLSVFGSITSLMFVQRWNLYLGISDSLFIMFTDIVTGTLGLAFTILPI